jgi:hypothetical protein
MKKTRFILSKIMLYKIFLICLFLTLIIHDQFLFSQGVGIGTGSPDASARLDVSSVNQGMLVPRMSSVQRDMISNPAEGLLIFNTVSKCFNFYRNGNWYEVCGNCIPPATPTSGNSGPVCENANLNLTAGNIPNATYAWTGPNGFTSSLQNPVIANISLSQAGVYSVTATINNCTSASSGTTVIVNPIPSAAFSWMPTPAEFTDTTRFTPSESGAIYSWTFQSGSPSSSTVQNPEVIWNAVGSYAVSLNISKNGCSNSSVDTVDVVNCPTGSQTVNYSGSIISMTIPPCVRSVTIEAWGAQGALNQSGTAGANGAYMKGTFSVQGGETYYVLVGGQGTQSPGANSSAGGGGSFVVIADPASSYIYNSVKVTPLIVAGGGGGVGSSGTQPGVGGSTGLDGTLDNRGYGQPGLNGYGGISGSVSNASGGGGGAGFIGDGLPKQSNSGSPGISFLNGGAGGASRDVLSYGGFGGAGGNHETNGGGGGGGGWSGGTGGQNEGAYGGGGGGGSYNSGSNQNNTSNTNTGNGKVVFSW